MNSTEGDLEAITDNGKVLDILNRVTENEKVFKQCLKRLRKLEAWRKVLCLPGGTD